MARVVLLAGVGGAALLLVVVTFAAAAALFPALRGPGNQPQTRPAPSAVTDIPASYLALYTAAARTCPGGGTSLWSVLAGVGKVETNHGRSNLPGVHSGANYAGAEGVMQFLPTTFAAVIARHPIPPGGQSPPSPYDPHDAIYTAAAYLCDSGANRGNLGAALFHYNHSTAYVNQVLAVAHRYAATTPTAPPRSADPSQSGPGTGNGGPAGPGPAEPAPTPAAAAAVAFAFSALGQPYQWGGNGPSLGEGFDCSGLSTAAYRAAGITLPRTADTQYRAGPLLPPGAPLAPGDLLFYRTPSRSGVIGHVALYIGAGRIIHAPDQGQPVQIAPTPTAGYAGASRPSLAPVAAHGPAHPARASVAPSGNIPPPAAPTRSPRYIDRHLGGLNPVRQRIAREVREISFGGSLPGAPGGRAPTDRRGILMPTPAPHEPSIAGLIPSPAVITDALSSFPIAPGPGIPAPAPRPAEPDPAQTSPRNTLQPAVPRKPVPSSGRLSIDPDELASVAAALEESQFRVTQAHVLGFEAPAEAYSSPESAQATRQVYQRLSESAEMISRSHTALCSGLRLAAGNHQANEDDLARLFAPASAPAPTGPPPAAIRLPGEPPTLAPPSAPSPDRSGPDLGRPHTPIRRLNI